MVSERDDQSPSSTQLETLGNVVRDLRESAGENQTAFALRFPVGRTTITEIENHRASANELRPQLVRDFPEAEERIEEALDQWTPRPRRNAGASAEDAAATPATLRQNIDRLVRSGQIDAATHLLEQLNRRKPRFIACDDTDENGYWIADQLCSLYTMRGDSRARDALNLAYFHARLGKGLRTETIECAVRISKRELKDGQMQKAHEPLEATLIDYPDAPQLWLQKGELLWIEEAYSAAYTALTTALTLQADRKEALRLRAQVLAEWGSAEAALSDIAAFWQYSPDYNVHACEILSAHAYLLVHSDGGLHRANKNVKYDREKHLRELKRADELLFEAEWSYGGHNIGLFNYRQAQYYIAMKDDEAKLESYKRALASKHPLDPVRRGIVERALDKHERSCWPQLDHRGKG